MLTREHQDKRLHVEFKDGEGVIHFIYVNPKFFREAVLTENEIPIMAGPRTDCMDVLVAALKEECITARIVPFRMLNRRTDLNGRAHLEAKSMWLFPAMCVTAHWN